LTCTVNPSGAWVNQQARNLALDFSGQGVRFLIRDRDSKYSRPFDEVFRSEGIRILKTPVRAPKANAIAERFVRTVRAECLDWLLIHNRRHLERVLHIYVDHYNRERPHRALELGRPNSTSDGRDRLRARSTVATNSAALSTNTSVTQHDPTFGTLQGRCEYRGNRDEQRH
jgi:transposase InsO family protein